MRIRAIVAPLVAVAGLSLSGCVYYQAPVMPPQGLLFTMIEAPMGPNVDRTSVSPRSGEASSIAVLGLIALGDSSMETAAANGNLSTVNHLDYKFMNVLFLYQSFTTVAHGE